MALNSPRMTNEYAEPRPDMAELLPGEARRGLDVGCRSGEFGRTRRGRQQLIRLVGVEPDKDAAEAARAIYDDVVTGLFPRDSAVAADDLFDVIYFNDVLEHMIEPV